MLSGNVAIGRTDWHFDGPSTSYLHGVDTDEIGSELMWAKGEHEKDDLLESGRSCLASERLGG